MSKRLVTYGLPVVAAALFSWLGYRYTVSTFASAPVPPAGIRITAGQSIYKSGEVVSVLLSNTTQSDAYVANNCPTEPLAVYRQYRGVWLRIHASVSDSKCAGEPHDYMIPAGQSVPLDYSYWPGLFSSSGLYRIVLPLESYPTGPSVTFTVSP